MKTNLPEDSVAGLLVQIIQNEMDLPIACVLQYNQKWNLPPDDSVHVTVQFLGSVTLQNRSIVENRGDAGFFEVQDQRKQEIYQVKIMSRNMDAYLRRQDVPFALSSIHSQQVQEDNYFYISPIMPEQDISSQDGAAIVSEYAYTVTTHAWYRKEKKIDFYDRFPGELWTEKKTGEDAYTFNPLDPNAP